MVSGIPFNGPIGAVRLAHHDGEWIAHPTYQEGDESTFELVVAGRQTRRRRHRHHDGRGRRHRGHLGALRGRRARRSPRTSSPRASRRPSSGSARRSTSSSSCAQAVREGPRPDRSRSPTSVHVDYDADVFAARRRRGAAPRSARRCPSPTSTTARRRLDELERPHRRAARRHAPTRPAQFAGRAERGQAGASARCRSRSCARASSTKACASTVAAPPTSGRCRPRSASSPRRTARACSSGARRRCSRSSRSACPAWSRCSTPSASTTASATCTTTTSRRSPPVRPAASVRRSAARSATARSPSGRSCRSFPTPVEWPYTLRVVSDVLVVERLHVDGVGLRLDAVADGRAACRSRRRSPASRWASCYAEGKYTTLTDILGAEDAFGDMDFKVAGTERVRHRAAARHEDRRPPRRRARAGAAPGASDARLQILDVMTRRDRRAARRRAAARRRRS